MHAHHAHAPIADNLPETQRLMRLASLFSLGVGIFLVSIKLVAWYLSDSLSLMSSLADSMLDVMASLINFVAIRYSLQPADEDHRFGHGKAEDLGTFAQSTFICGSGLFIIIESIRRIFQPEATSDSMVGISVMVVSILFSLILVIYQKSVVRKTASTAVAADAMHYIGDIATNIGVIFALWVGNSVPYLDPVIAILIALYLLYGSWQMGYAAFHHLMDREFLDNDRDRIEAIAFEYQEIGGIHDLRTRKSGIYSFIQFHLDFKDEHITLYEAHNVSHAIAQRLRELFPNTEILIHQDPMKR